ASGGMAAGRSEASTAGGRAAGAEAGRGGSRESSSGAGSGCGREGECSRQGGGVGPRGENGAVSTSVWHVGGADGRRTTGAGTEGQAMQARARRERMNSRMRQLQALVPGAGCMTTESFLEEAVQYVHFLQRQVADLTASLHVNQSSCSTAASTGMLFSRPSTLPTHMPRIHTAFPTAALPLASTTTAGWVGKAQQRQAWAPLRESGAELERRGGGRDSRCAGGRVSGWRRVGEEMQRRQLCLVPVGALMPLLEPGGMVDRALMLLQKNEEQRDGDG
ncbi:hypothetical protein CLOP_g21617, partial [Closterium sp. NIES-67]